MNIRGPSQAASDVMSPAGAAAEALPRRMDSNLSSESGSRSASTSDGRSSVTHHSSSLIQPLDTVSERTNRLSSAVVDAANSSKARLSRRRKEAQSLARLRLDALRLHGREDDLNFLKDELFALKKGGSRQDAILVAGVSGVGKSALVARGLKTPAEKMGVAFASGKFDLNKNALPFSAFAGALSELTKHVMAQKNAAKIKADIKEELGDDALIIRGSIQGCGELFSSDETESNPQQEDLGGGGKEAVNRLQYAIRRLMKIVCTNLEGGVVLFIDDLQWADASSLDLLQSLMQDKEIPSFLIVGAYRDDEVSESHSLILSIREAERLGSNIATVQLGNLECSSVQSLVAEALNMEDEEGEVESIAKTVFKKTSGNPFFVLAFLTSLYDDELLVYNFGVERWRWDDDRVSEVLMTENVVSILVKKLMQFDSGALTVVKIASCLGASFSIEMVATAIKQSSSADLQSGFEDGDIEEAIQEYVREFEEDGLLERDIDGICSFAHDQIQSAANGLIPEDRRDGFRGELGQTLLNNLDAALLEHYLFDVVSLCNCSSDSLSVLERKGLGLMNLRAGMKASNWAAFDTACVYFQAARELLEGMSWEENRDQMTKLYIAEANARFVVGDLGVTESLANELLQQRGIPTWDRFKATEVLILAFLAANRFDEAIALGLDLRKELGFKAIPTKPTTFTVLTEFFKTNRAIKGLSAEELASLPTCTDERAIIGQRILELLYPTSCAAVVSLAMILAAFGDIKRAKEMGKATELLLDRPGMREAKSRARYALEGFIFHWKAPIQNSLTPSLNGYLSGLEIGDTESAGWNLCFRCCFSYFAGRPLMDLKAEMATHISVIDQLNAIGNKYCTMPFLQATHNLVESSATPWILSGECMDFDDTLQFSEQNSNALVRCYATVVQLDLFVIFQQWDAAKKLLVDAGDLNQILLTVYHAVRLAFLDGLISLKAAQLSRSWRERRKWTKRAQKTMKTMKGWIKKGNVNVVHTSHLLEAEYAVLKGRHEQAEEQFKQAAKVARRNGFRQDRALSHELAGIYYTENGDAYWADHHLKKAHEVYLEWEAKSKAEHLASKYPLIVEKV
ncbi:hypothetical protein ACHAXT_004263 [Thalassiosira profunda]